MPMLLAVALLAAAPLPKEAKDDLLLQALAESVETHMKQLPSSKDSPLYYLSYRVADGQSFVISSSLGALSESDGTGDAYTGKGRTLDVSVRVGNRQLDNTHQLRGRGRWDFESQGSSSQLPIEDDPRALRIALWRSTDRAYKAAQKQLIKVRTERTLKTAEEDKSDDFSVDPSNVFIGEKVPLSIERAAWAERVKKLSAKFRGAPEILDSQVTLMGMALTTYFVDSEGSRIRQPRLFLRFLISGSVKADDGMDLDLNDTIEVTTLDQLPDDAMLEARVQKLIDTLLAMRKAPPAEPYSGPAIITSKAAAVFFHEIFGHRIEGHRQKDADEGQTFTRRIEQRVLPEFLSVTDDPTKTSFGPTPLNGFYRFDEEGQKAQAASLVDKGILKTFLMSRSPVKGFAHSNGHGRAQPGLPPVARQGNLLVSSSSSVPFEKLKAQLLEQVKARGKPYGLVFHEVSGGFTNTRTGGLPQAFKVLPLVVTRVYPDGREELVRGVDIVGTPLASFERITTTGDDVAVFNGFCGAESGWVPVSAVAPSMLVSDIEVERRSKRHERGPLLPSPFVAKGGAK